MAVKISDMQKAVMDFLLETLHFVKTLNKQKVNIFFLSTLIVLNVMLAPGLSGYHA